MRNSAGTDRDRHAFARVEFGDHSADRRGQGEARRDATAGFDPTDLFLGHAGQAHALARAFHHSLHALAQFGIRDASGREILFLGGDPFGHIEFRQRLMLAHGIERRTHEQLLDETVAARLYHRDIAFVVGDAAHRFDARRQRAQHDFGRADAQVLLQRAD